LYLKLRSSARAVLLLALRAALGHAKQKPLPGEKAWSTFMSCAVL